ncbi:MAG: nicotinate-nucleotide pyrophosphorylase [Candidatus Krumholzibacteriota bacterium]|nr:nicotinate-nucleotide pyrophosphorylase [Candidatus Krumholzibacteriota bacterium]
MTESGENTGLDEGDLRRIVSEALREDSSSNDITTSYLGIGDRDIAASIVARAEGVIAGIGVARIVFEEAGAGVRYQPRTADGSRVTGGTAVADIEGRASVILSAERTALNFLQRLSGVATLTAAFVERVKGTGATILDTRKTTPLLRSLEKYAVRAGGGRNHRRGLGDMVLVKDNHLQILGGSGLRELLARATPPADVEVEVDSIAALRGLLGAPVQRIMLDNFTPRGASEAVRLIAEYRRDHPGFAPAVEVSGGVDLGNVREYALTGVDFISVGALTHSAPALNLALEVAGEPARD